jgi:hypothetical protein
MGKLRNYKYPVFMVIVFALFIGFFFLNSIYTLDHLVIRQITATQAADAIKNDHFWVSYREDTLPLTGEVTSVTKSGNDTEVGLKTDSFYTAECSLKNFQGTITHGQTIKLLTIANDAERMPSGVKLKKCLIP